MNRQIWIDWKINKPCPTCLIGRLVENGKTSFNQSETYASKLLTSDGYPSFEYVFTEQLKCNNCGEAVVAMGNKSEDSYPNVDGENDLFIKYFSFYPHPNIIDIPKSCPETVKKVLYESFGLFWIDKNSCANKIRIAVEALMDLKTNKTQINQKGKRKTITLHDRIMLYKLKNPEVSNYLLAIKWTGNAGSHLSNVTVEQLLDSYELMEYALELLYNDRRKDLTKKSKAINKRKKP